MHYETMIFMGYNSHEENGQNMDFHDIAQLGN